MNIFELIAALIICSYSNLLNKIRFTFEVFDFTGHSSIEFEDLIFIFKCFIIGYARMTKTQLPEMYKIDYYCR